MNEAGCFTEYIDQEDRKLGNISGMNLEEKGLAAESMGAQGDKTVKLRGKGLVTWEEQLDTVMVR